MPAEKTVEQPSIFTKENLSLLPRGSVEKLLTDFEGDNGWLADLTKYGEPSERLLQVVREKKNVPRLETTVEAVYPPLKPYPEAVGMLTGLLRQQIIITGHRVRGEDISVIPLAREIKPMANMLEMVFSGEGLVVDKEGYRELEAEKARVVTLAKEKEKVAEKNKSLQKALEESRRELKETRAELEGRLETEQHKSRALEKQVEALAKELKEWREEFGLMPLPEELKEEIGKKPPERKPAVRRPKEKAPPKEKPSEIDEWRERIEVWDATHSDCPFAELATARIGIKTIEAALEEIFGLDPEDFEDKKVLKRKRRGIEKGFHPDRLAQRDLPKEDREWAEKVIPVLHVLIAKRESVLEI